MTEQPQLLTPSEYGAYLLSDGAALRTAELKLIPFSGVSPTTDAPVRLAAHSVEDLATWLAMAGGLSYLDKQKDVLKAFDSFDQPTDVAKLAALDASWLVQAVVRKADGSAEMDPADAIPRVQINGAKLGQLLQAGTVRVLVQDQDLGESKALKAVVGALSSRATHLVKLSVDSGASRADVKGGLFNRALLTAAPEFAGSVTEVDYVTRISQSLTCTAGYQGNDWLAFTRVEWQGQYDYLVDLLRSDRALSDQVQAVMTDWPRMQGLDALFETLHSVTECPLSGEPQLFCGEGSAAAVVAPLMPVSLPNELLRAKESLREMRMADLAPIAAAAQSQADAAEAALDAHKAIGSKAFEGGKTAYAAKLALLKTAHAQAKAQAKAAASALNAKGEQRLAIPTFTLAVGGANPQNTGSGITPAIKSAPILTTIRERAVQASVSPKVFYSDWLVEVPAIQAGKTPLVLQDGANLASDKAARKALFSRWALAALAPLLELRDAWAQGASEATAQYADAFEELARAVERKDPKALFVVGSSGVSGVAAVEQFMPLTSLVMSRVIEGARRAFKGVVLTPFDAELRAAAQAVVLTERT